MVPSTPAVIHHTGLQHCALASIMIVSTVSAALGLHMSTSHQSVGLHVAISHCCFALHYSLESTCIKLLHISAILVLHSCLDPLVISLAWYGSLHPTIFTQCREWAQLHSLCLQQVWESSARTAGIRGRRVRSSTNLSSAARSSKYGC